MKISNRNRCCATCRYWQGLAIKHLSEVEVCGPMSKGRCNCRYNASDSGYYTRSEYVCKFFEKNKSLKWHEERA